MAIELTKEATVDPNDYRSLLIAGRVDEARALFSTKEKKVEEALKQWNVATHVVHDRPKKYLDDNTEVKQWKLPIPYQKKIVNSTVAFLFGKPLKLVQLSEGTDEAFAVLKDLWDDMRMSSVNRKNARTVFSQTVSAKLFLEYRDADADKEDTTKFNSAKCILLSQSNGDIIYTKKDMYGVMECIARGYKVTSAGKVVEYFDAYFKDTILNCIKTDGTWEVKSNPNLVKKIPISYYDQDETEWNDVQDLIERLEMLTSKKADNNDYTGDAILVLTGDVESLPGKEETGKVVRLSGDNASANYLAPSMAVDMAKNEDDRLTEFIHYFTDTINLSTDQLASLGQDSGKALEMRFFPAVLKSMDKQEVFAEMTDREINIMKSMISNVIRVDLASQVKKLKVGVEFGNPLPDNIADFINILSTAVGGKPIMSQKTAIGLNPLVKNASEEETAVSDESLSTIVD